MAYWTCNDCGAYDSNDTNRYGEGYCTERCQYYPKSDRACNKFYNKPDYVSDCFLTTAMCHIFGMTDDCYVLNTMRNFRDTILVNDSKYHTMLAQYEVIGPLISRCLYNDSHRDEVADYYFENYIYDIIVSINNNGNYEEIVNKYVEMGYDMKRMYGISKEVSSDDIKKLTKKIENKQYKVKNK